jgi:hypothetical protein
MWSNLALAQLGGGNRAAYRATCVAMIDRFGKSPDGATLSQLFMTCAVTPDANADMPAFATLAAGLFRNVAYAPWYHYPLPALLYRSGKMPEAIAAIDRHIFRLNQKMRVQPLEGLLLAMAYQRLGKYQEARDYLTQVETWRAAADKQEGDSLGGVRPAWPQWRVRVVVRALHDEAVVLFLIMRGRSPKRHGGEALIDESWELKDLRRTCATYFNEYVPESSIEILGHSVGGIAYRHYAHRAPLAFKAIRTIPQPTAFSALIKGYDGEWPCDHA